MEQNRQRATRVRGWARPERELTPAEKKKAERKERQQKEQEKYLGVPKDVLPFQHCLLCPKDVPIFRLLGGNLQNLDKLRAEFKSFIWIERDTMVWLVVDVKPLCRAFSKWQLTKHSFGEHM